jgi:hypothetical protein
MPRRKKLEPKLEPGFQLREHPVEGARELITLGPEHPCWGGIPFGCDGAFVRVIPPDGATDEQVRYVVETAKQMGAVAVRVLPRRRQAVVVEPRAARPHVRARDVVLELVGASNVEDRVALGEFCERVMGKVGL